LGIANEHVRKTYRLMGQLKAVLSTAKDAETGQRGFMLTGDESFLTPYQNALGSMPRQLNQLRNTLYPNPPQLERFTLLKQLIEANFDQIGRALEDHKSNPAAAASLVQAAEGKQIMDRLLAVIGEMKAEESAHLERQLAEAASQARFEDVGRLSIVAVDVITLGSVLLILRKMKYLRRMITICAWTHQIKYEGK
jgi:methyl-accepting chemotaxis protein